jgi:2,4-dienoyl-CoA reductase-like NADH-dependent reductase (Old Yellow Enzyme family)
MANFKYLFSPIKIGSMEVPNRIVMAPHTNNFERGTDADVAYHVARAEGGAGMLILSAALVSPVSYYIGYFPPLYDRSGIAGHARVIDAIHKAGSKALVEIMWLGGYGGSPQASGIAPQQIVFSQTRSLTIPEIKEIVENYGNAALYAKEAGADGVEVTISFGVSLQLFVSPLYNKRTDEYGGSMENRLRIVFEIIDAIRERCGRDFVVGFVVDVDEAAMGGHTLEEGVQVCKMLADTGKIDYLRPSARNIKAQQGYMHYPSSFLPQGLHLDAISAVREAVSSVPIIGGWRINSAEFAEQALADGKCDLVSMVRALIADPELPNKAKRGDLDEIRACIGDVEACYGRFTLGMPIGCSVNPACGCELGKLQPAEKKKKVAVIGGGVAGMQAALTASLRGHSVTLIEREDALGGHVNLESQLPGLSDRSDIVRWLTLQLQKQKVDIQLNTNATAESIQGLGADAVVLATGANYSRSGITPDQLNPIPGVEADFVLTPEDVLIAKKTVGQHVVVYDTTGYLVGSGLAEMFADQGKNVDFVITQPYMGVSLTPLYIHMLIPMRVMPKTNFVRDTAVVSIDNRCVNLMNTYTFVPSTIEDVDTVVLVTSKPPNEELYHALLGKVPELYLIGDAQESRYATFSIYAATTGGNYIGTQI